MGVFQGLPLPQTVVVFLHLRRRQVLCLTIAALLPGSGSLQVLHSGDELFQRYWSFVKRLVVWYDSSMSHDESVIEKLQANGLMAALLPEVNELMAGGERREKAVERLNEKYPDDTPVEALVVAPATKVPSAKDERDYRLAIEWVAAKMTKLGVKENDAPSEAAWGILMWARSTDQNQAKFYTDLLPKVFPTKQEIDREARYTDDGRVLKLVQELMKERLA